METSATERVRVVGPGQTYIGKQGFTYGAGASSETVGAERICMNVLPMPDGRRANAHYHRGVEQFPICWTGIAPFIMARP
jgi:uncharacterized RmlC-like cupin family protein